MESRTYNRSASVEKKLPEKAKKASNCKCEREKRRREERPKEKSQDKERLNRGSLIPVLKFEKIDTKSLMREQKPSRESSKSPCSCPCPKKQVKDEDYEIKLKILEEKEKCIAEYYLKIEDTLRKLLVQKNQKVTSNPAVEPEATQNSFARKMTSDPEVFRKGKSQNKILSDFENNIEEISSIWLKTSADLFKTLKDLKKNPSLDPMEFEIENQRIQVAIKQAKSLTLLKTKTVIAEAKKLYHHGEMIRTELENLLSPDSLKLPRGKGQNGQDSSGKTEADGTGDSTKQMSLENIQEAMSGEECLQEKANKSEETKEERSELTRFRRTSSEMISEEMETLAAELAKKNETITGLNNKIFELQKTCNEHQHKFNQLQGVLTEFQEKIQWNQVLWKQIGKLKERIHGLQQSNKQLEAHKKELESRITKLDKELERLIKLNQLLNQKKHLLEAQGGRMKEIEHGGVEEKCRERFGDEAQEKILLDKQNAINQLKSVLIAMRDQENFALKQIAMFQSRIEALEKKVEP